MYAKLVMSSTPTQTNYNDFCRDVIRLITSNSPSTALLSSNTWNVAASTVFDNTPAGWTYVGSNFAGESSALLGPNNSGGNPADGAWYQWVASAPCASPLSGKTKFVVMTSQRNQSYDNIQNTNYGNQIKNSCSLGACTASTSAAVLTNESYRSYVAGTNGWTQLVHNDWGFAGTGTYHLIANARHVTLIKENSNMQALWEHSATDPHIFYNIAPMLHFSWTYATAGGTPSWATGVGANNIVNSQAYDGAWVMNITDTATGTNYGSRPVNVSGSNDYFSNGANQPYLWPHLNKVTTSNSASLARHLVSPIMFHLFHHGYPTMYVTGTVPIYLMKGGVGTTGDSININGTIYTYFNVNAAMGLAMLTN